MELTHEGEGRGGINLKKKKNGKERKANNWKRSNGRVSSVREREKEREKTSLRTK